MTRPHSPTPSRYVKPLSYHNNLPIASRDITIGSNATKQVALVDDDDEPDNKILETVTTGLNRYFLKLLKAQSH